VFKSGAGWVRVEVRSVLIYLARLVLYCQELQSAILAAHGILP
jgi:hypothetical protein